MATKMASDVNIFCHNHVLVVYSTDTQFYERKFVCVLFWLLIDQPSYIFYECIFNIMALITRNRYAV